MNLRWSWNKSNWNKSSYDCLYSKLQTILCRHNDSCAIVKLYVFSSKMYIYSVMMCFLKANQSQWWHYMRKTSWVPLWDLNPGKIARCKAPLRCSNPLDQGYSSGSPHSNSGAWLILVTKEVMAGCWTGFIIYKKQYSQIVEIIQFIILNKCQEKWLLLDFSYYNNYTVHQSLLLTVATMDTYRTGLSNNGWGRVTSYFGDTVIN